MIVLDTNIVSVFMTAGHPDRPFLEAWRESSLDQDFRVTAVTLAEIAYGVAILPPGSRKTRLAEAADTLFRVAAPTVLVFGAGPARRYGAIMASRRAQGRPVNPSDAQIAAIAGAAGAAVATRNTPDFLDCDVQLINPYDS